MWVRFKLGSIWLMVGVDKCYRFDVILDFRFEIEFDFFCWVFLCNIIGYVVMRKEMEEGCCCSYMLILGEKMRGIVG